MSALRKTALLPREGVASLAQQMGKASQGKKQAQALGRDRPHLIQKTLEQVEILRVLGASFDSGHRVVGYPLATTIRVLVHDTGISHALLSQLGALGTMEFLDTSLPIDPRNLLSHGGLVLMRMTAGTGGEWVPRKEVAEPTPGAEPRNVSFQQWWNADVMKDTGATLWSRSRMVISLANKEGGAHVDPTQPVDVHAIEDQNSMGWTYHDPVVGDQPMSRGPLMPSIRQIAYELELSITEYLASGRAP